VNTFRTPGDRREAQRGQGIVEFAYLVPVLMLILLAILEFGFMFNHHLTLEYATREGARAGAAMADGTVKDANCGLGPLTGANVDPLIIAAVQRVLESPGSLVNRANITQVKIYEMPWNGTTPTGPQNVWTYRPGNAANPDVPCLSPATDLDFYESAHGWDASARTIGATPDSIGISISYDYKFQTPLAGIIRVLFGNSWGTIRMTDSTIMALEPTS
jgi:TadE-like protein